MTAERKVGLEHFEIGEKLIESRRGSFMVRGMNTEDLTFLVTNYLEDLILAITQFGKDHDVSGQTLIEKKALPELFFILTNGFPLLTAELISRCADKPELLETVRRMAFPVQIQALAAITELTTEDAGGLGNLLAAIRSLLETRGLHLGPLAKNLQTIIGKPAAT